MKICDGELRYGFLNVLLISVNISGSKAKIGDKLAFVSESDILQRKQVNIKENEIYNKETENENIRQQKNQGIIHHRSKETLCKKKRV